MLHIFFFSYYSLCFSCSIYAAFFLRTIEPNHDGRVNYTLIIFFLKKTDSFANRETVLSKIIELTVRKCGLFFLLIQLCRRTLGSNPGHLARSHPHSARLDLIHNWARSHPQLGYIQSTRSARYHLHSARSHPYSARSHP
jgi:hypothetical protein